MDCCYSDRKSAVIADCLKRSNVSICCLRETRWKRAQAKQIGHGYKLSSFGESNNRNGVAIAVTEPLNQNNNVSRINDRIMTIKFLVEEHGRPIHNISACERQIGCTECEKDEFYEILEDVLLKLDGDVYWPVT